MQGVPAYAGTMQFGDFAFIGRGIDGADIHIGIELKRSKDLVSSVQSKRFSGHQLLGLIPTYDHVWLLTEGIWRAGSDGIFEHFVGGWKPVRATSRVMMNDIEAWILSQVICGGVNYWHCSTQHDTVRFLSVLYRWWTDKDLDQHRSHQVIYLPPPGRAAMVEPSDTQKMISCIPGVGWEKSAVLEQMYGSMNALCLATPKDLQAIDGVGPKIAKKIVDTLHGGPR